MLNKLYLCLFILLNYSNLLGQDDPKKADIQVKIEVTKLSQEGQTLMRNRKWKEVERIADSIAQKNPSSPESYYLRGTCFYGKGEYSKSIENLQKAVQLQSNHDPSLFFLGLNYFKMGQWNRAVEYFSSAAESGSFHPFYRYNLALALFVSGDYERAIIESERTLQLKENYFKAKVILVKSLYKMDKKFEALEIAREMYERKQESEKIHSLYAELLVEKEKNYRKAIQVLSSKPNLSLEDRRIAGFSYMQLGEWEKAIVHYKNFVRFEKDTEEDALNLIRCLIWAGKEAEAEIYLSRLIASNRDKRKFFSDVFQEAIDKKNLTKEIYSPIF